MKKLFLLLIVFSLTTNINIAQTIVLSEDFESAPYDLTSSGTTTWDINTRIQVSGTNSDSCVVGLSGTSYLTSNQIVTTANNSVILEFKHICKIEFFDAGKVQYSIDGGITWIDLTTTEYIGSGSFTSNKFTAQSYAANWQASTASALPQNSWWQTEQFDLGSVAGNQADLRIRFVLSDGNNNGPNQNAGWYIDDIKVTIAPSELTPPTILQLNTIWTDTVYTTGPFQVNAKITDASGIDTAYVVYNTNGGANDTLGMQISAVPDTFSVNIPAQVYNTHIEYYIVAIDASASNNSAATALDSFYVKQAAPTVIIGNGTTVESYIPCYGFYNYGWSSTVYSSQEIGTSGFIDSVFFDVSNTISPYVMTNQRMMMAVIPDSVFTDGLMPDSASMISVYNGDVTWTGPGWFKFELSTPFYYPGSGHLMIYWINRDGSYTSGYPSFNSTSTTPIYKAKYKYSDTYSNVFPNSTGTMYYNRPNIKLAFEINNNVHDAAVVQITEPLSTPIPTVGTPYDVKTIIKNVGSDTLTNLTITWALNGVPQTPYVWNGSLLQDQASTEITIGSATFTNSGNNTILVYSALPDGFVDEQPLNDTLSRTYYACTGILGGNYTIDPLVSTGGTNFQYFNDVISELNNCGINDTTIFNIVSGTYDTTLTFGDISGAADSAWVIFQSSTGIATDVILTDSAITNGVNYIIDFNGADFMVFRNMTFEPKGLSYGRSITFRNNSSNINIEGNIFNGVNTTSTSSELCHIYNYSASIDSNIVIRDNDINDGSYGIYLYGSSTTSLENGNIIENNNITDFHYIGIYTYYQKNIQIIGNEVKSSTNYTSPYGLALRYNDFATVSGNKIYVPAYYGVYYYYCDGDNTNHGKFNNNFISIGGTGTSYGMYCSTSNYTDIYHNSFNCYGTNTTSGRAFYIAGGDNNDLKNNSFENSGGGYAIYSSTTAFTSDYNNLYATGTNLGYYSSTNRIDLAAWSTATGQDANSISLLSYYNSYHDLHVYGLNLDSKGAPIASITTDIDGDIRDVVTPDIGADEYTPSAFDAIATEIVDPLISCGLTATETISFAIENFGTSTITNFDASYSVDGAAPITESFTLNILSGDQDTAYFTTNYDFSTYGNYDIEIIVDLSGDTIAINDTIRRTVSNGHDFSLGAYTLGFESNEYNKYSLWSYLDVNLDANTWAIPYSSTTYAHNGDYSAKFANGSTNIGDDWMFSRCFNLEAGKTYKVSYWYRAENGSYSQNIDLRLLTDITPASVIDTLDILSGFANTSYLQSDTMFTVPSDSIYYFAWYAYSNAASYGAYIDDINIEEMLDDNVSPIAILQPSSLEGSGSNQNVEIIVYNNGINDQDTIPIAYSWNAGGAVIDTLFTNIAYQEQDTIIFSTPATFISGQNNLVVYTDLSTDGFRINDTITSTSFGLDTLIAPLTDNFDGTVYWFDSILVNTGSQWELGLPAYGTTNSTHSAPNSWDVNLNTAYTNDAEVTLYSSIIDFSDVVLPRISVWMNYNTESCCDGTRLDYRIDGGNWTTLGLLNDPQGVNWYNVANVSGLSSDGWAGTSSGWVQAKLIAPILAGENAVQFRFFFAADGSGINDGFSIDNFQIEEIAPDTSVTLLSVVNPSNHMCGASTEDISIEFRNTGLDTITNLISATYFVQGSAGPVTETIPFTTFPNETDTFTFSSPYDFSTVIDSTFLIDIYLSLVNDTNVTDDTLHHVFLSLVVPSDPIVNNVTISYGSDTVLAASSTYNMFWYDVASGGTYIFNGDTLQTPILYDTTVYYVEAVSSAPYLRFTEVTQYKTGTGATSPYPAYATGDDFIEITNLGLSPINLAGYELIVDGTGARTYIFPTVILSSGDVMVVHIGPGTNDSTNLYFNTGGSNNVISSNSLSGYLLIDTYGNIVDAVALNGHSFTTGLNVTASDWTGNISSSSGYAGASRIIIDNNDAADWLISSSAIPQTLGSLNTGFATNYGAGCSSNRIADTVFVINIPTIDVGVIAIDDPNSGIDLTNTETITVRVKNFGTLSQTNIPVNFSINGAAPITEIISSTILPGDTLTYLFTATANLSSYSTYSLAAYTSFSGDTIFINDTSYKSVSNSMISYCAAGATSTGYEDITGFGIGTTLYTNAATGALYTDYTNLAAFIVAPGQIYDITVISDFPSGYSTQYNCWTNVFIDYNYDGDFDDAGELVFGSATLSSNTVSSTFTIPANPHLGLTRVRVALREGGAELSTGPCGTWTWGEVEDYMIMIIPPIPFDAGVINISSPDFIQSEGHDIPVEVDVHNFGTDTLTSIPIEYIANGGTAVPYTWVGSLPPGDTVSITLPDVTVQTDSNDLCAYTVVIGDSNTFNDNSCTYFYGLPPIVLFEDDMENGTLLTPDQFPTYWQWGKPIAQTINYAHSGDSVWTTILHTNYANSSETYLNMPSMTFSGVTDAYLTFYYWMDAEENVDGGYIQYSLNNGFSWLSLGGINQPDALNWFDSYLIGATTGWSHATNGWKPAFIKLSALDGMTNVKIRFGFKSNSSVYANGFALDDIKILAPKIPVDAGVINIDQPSGSTSPGNAITVSVTIKNFGSDTLYSIPLSYNLNTGYPPQNGTWAGTLLPDSTASYTFTNTYNGPAQDYRLCAYTSLSSDPYKGNDSTCVNIQMGQANTDAGISAILSPISTSISGTTVTVQARIKNYGINTLTSIPLHYSINAIIQASEVWTGTLNSGDSVDYTFTNTYLGPISQYNLCVKTQLAGDQVSSNDEICNSILTSIEETSINGIVLLQNVPNPANDKTEIRFTLPKAGSCKISVRNALGKMIYGISTEGKVGENVILLKTGEFSQGIYFYSLEYEDIILTRRFTIIH